MIDNRVIEDIWSTSKEDQGETQGNPTGEKKSWTAIVSLRVEFSK